MMLLSRYRNTENSFQPKAFLVKASLFGLSLKTCSWKQPLEHNLCNCFKSCILCVICKNSYLFIKVPLMVYLVFKRWNELYYMYKETYLSYYILFLNKELIKTIWLYFCYLMGVNKTFTIWQKTWKNPLPPNPSR